MEVVGAAEVADMLGVSRQRVHQLARTPGFPRPMATLSAGLIWWREDIAEWARRVGRLDGED